MEMYWLSKNRTAVEANSGFTALDSYYHNDGLYWTSTEGHPYNNVDMDNQAIAVRPGKIHEVGWVGTEAMTLLGHSFPIDFVNSGGFIDLLPKQSQFAFVRPVRKEKVALGTLEVGQSYGGGVIFHIQETVGDVYATNSATSYCCPCSEIYTHYYDGDGDGEGDPNITAEMCLTNPMTIGGGCVGAGCWY